MIISSSENEHIKLYKKLSDSPKSRRENGLFTLEGRRLITDFKGSFHTVFFTEENTEYIKNVKTERLFEISENLAAKISDTKSPQGIFAVAKIPRPEIKTEGAVLVLHTVRDPGNLGTIIRTADALGFSDIFAVDCADIYSPKTVRSAMGSLFRVNIEVSDEDTVFSKLSGYETYAAVLSDTAEKLGEVNFGKRIALFIGNEANGLPDSVIKKCGHLLTIPMNGNAESLNAAAAASILLWEAAKST
jgi:TrmH family RNA methyltransferase